MGKLTDIQAEALRIVATTHGSTPVSNDIAVAMYGLLSTEMVSLGITPTGRIALAEYDAERRAGPAQDTQDRARIASGMSSAGRAALAAAEGGTHG